MHARISQSMDTLCILVPYRKRKKQSSLPFKDPALWVFLHAILLRLFWYSKQASSITYIIHTPYDTRAQIQDWSSPLSTVWRLSFARMRNAPPDDAEICLVADDSRFGEHSIQQKMLSSWYGRHDPSGKTTKQCGQKQAAPVFASILLPSLPII